MQTFSLCCVYNISLRISRSVVLLAANCLSLSWNVLVSPPILKDSFSQLAVIYFEGLKSIMPCTLECWGLFTDRLHTFSLNVALLKNLGSSYLTKTLHACSHCLAYLCTCFWCTSLWGIRLQVEQLRLREAITSQGPWWLLWRQGLGTDIDSYLLCIGIMDPWQSTHQARSLATPLATWSLAPRKHVHWLENPF